MSKELYYYPAWYNDKKFFIKLLSQSTFSEKDVLQFGRLFIKYSHINCSDTNELNNYFNYILQKMQLYNKTNLFKKTKYIYNNK